MPFTTISRAISTGIQRNVTISELKHEAKVDDIKRELAVQSITRKAVYGRKLTEARIEHAVWQASLSEEGQKTYEASLNDIEAIVNPAPTQS